MCWGRSRIDQRCVNGQTGHDGIAAGPIFRVAAQKCHEHTYQEEPEADGPGAQKLGHSGMSPTDPRMAEEWERELVDPRGMDG